MLLGVHPHLPKVFKEPCLRLHVHNGIALHCPQQEASKGGLGGSSSRGKPRVKVSIPQIEKQ